MNKTALKNSTFNRLYETAAVNDGVKELSYEEFVQLRDSGEKHVLLDVLLDDSYKNGHIEGAESFPVGTINKKTAAERLSKNSNIVVYCASFQCTASTTAAKTLSGLGYRVLDYKGGFREWTKRGNKLVR